LHGILPPYVLDDPIVAEFAATVGNDVVVVVAAAVIDAIVVVDVAVEANGPVAEPITETQIDH
jgi:hypothetical protein